MVSALMKLPISSTKIEFDNISNSRGITILAECQVGVRE